MFALFFMFSTVAQIIDKPEIILTDNGYQLKTMANFQSNGTSREKACIIDQQFLLKNRDCSIDQSDEIRDFFDSHESSKYSDGSSIQCSPVPGSNDTEIHIQILYYSKSIQDDQNFAKQLEDLDQQNFYLGNLEVASINSVFTEFVLSGWKEATPPFYEITFEYSLPSFFQSYQDFGTRFNHLSKLLVSSHWPEYLTLIDTFLTTSLSKKHLMTELMPEIKFLFLSTRNFFQLDDGRSVASEVSPGNLRRCEKQKCH